ncbi:cell surface protein SprA [bacterium]|nr:cell surface protein SprA [bacterium]
MRSLLKLSLMLFACLIMSGLVAHAGVGFSVSLIDDMTNNDFFQQEERGISAFSDRALFKSSQQLVVQRIEIDSLMTTATFRTQFRLLEIQQPSIMSYETYKQMRLRKDIQDLYREEYAMHFLPQAKAGGGEGIAIDVPFRIKSKAFRRIFGGDNIGLRVSGQITIDGKLSQQKLGQVSQATQQDKSTSFHIDMQQRFSITGKVGEKVEVKVDQDSERLFDFENSIMLTYTGNENEIIKKVEAGNVSLNMSGPQRATISGRNKGLFGLKTEAQIGNLNLTGIASLERGQKNRLSPHQNSRRTPFTEKEILRDQYFWLSKDSIDFLGDPIPLPNYREQYRHYSASRGHTIAGDSRILGLQVYITTIDPPINETALNGEAVALNYYRYYNGEIPKASIPTNDYVYGSWRLMKEYQYDLDPLLGTIRFKQRMSENEAIACAFVLENGQMFGSYGTEDEINPDSLQLILLRTKSPSPADSGTWDLMFRHVYSLGGQNIDPEDFKIDIIRKASSSNLEEIGPPTDDRSYLTVFGFDIQGESGGDPDGKVDNTQGTLIDYVQGELHFLDLTPFDPSGYWIGDGYEDSSPLRQLNEDSTSQDYGSGYLNPALYTKAVGDLSSTGSKWNFVAEFTGVSSVYELGVLVLEGSEEVYLNGNLLQRGVGYTIDYLSGRLTIIDPAAKLSGAELDITYESGTVFQIDKKTLLGLRAEYGLWGDAANRSYVGGMMLYLNEQTMDRRVRVGNEPMRNTLYDINTVLNFKPKFLTPAVNMLPLVQTSAESRFSIEGEFAQVLPNPNALSNDATGDKDGLAFLDDFEGSRRATPLGMMRGNWSIASIPEDEAIDKRRGRFKWWNPMTEQQVEVQEVFPEKETNNDVAERLQTMIFEFVPDETANSNPRRSWGGVMRYLGEGFANQSQTKFIEFWIELPGNPEGRLVVDLGTISEDALPDGKMSSEDTPIEGEVASNEQREYGNGILDNGEDTGIDGIGLPDPADSAYWNGLENPPVPSWDDYGYSPGSSDFEFVNGMEGNGGNGALEGNEDPDTEDLNRNKILDTENSYFSYSIDLDYDSPYIVGGEETERWRLFRVPLDSLDNPVLDIVGQPSMSDIRWARVYMTGMSRRTRLRIVQMDLVSNEWLPEDDTENITITVINNHENPGYESPPGVQGEIDPITNLRQREQSLVLQLNNLREPYFIAKNLYQDVNLIQYQRMKMFIHGGGINDNETNSPHFKDNTYEVVLRLGKSYGNIHNDYYEIIQTIKPGWAPDYNTIDIALDSLSHLHIYRENYVNAHNDSVDGSRSAEERDSGLAILDQYARFAYAIDETQPGDSIAIFGRPSLQNVEFIAIGVRPIKDENGNPRNPHISSEGLEIWADELRLTNIHKDAGTAVEMRADLALADFMTLNGTFSQIDADFHRVDERMTGASLVGREDKLAYRGNVTLNLHKFFLERWNISIPVTMNYTEELGTPKFIPNTDARVDREDAQDSIKSYTRKTGYTASFSKTGSSPSPIVRWSIEKLKLNWNHSDTRTRGFTRGRSTSKRTDVSSTYNFPTATGRGIAPLWFLRPVPMLSLIGSPRLHFKPKTLQFGFTANQADERSRNQAGVRTVRPSFSMTQKVSTSYEPFQPLSLTYDRNHSTVHRSDSLHTKGWKELFAGSLGELTSASQTASANYSPHFTSWFSPAFSYGSRYDWSNRNLEDEANQEISNNRSLGGDVTLDFRSVLGGGDRGGRGRAAGGRREREPDQGAAEDDSTEVARPPGPSLAKRLSTVLFPFKKALSILDPVTLSYDNSISHSDRATLGQATPEYQFGLTQDPGIPRVENTTNIPSLTTTDSYSGRSGIRFTRNISTTLNYNWRQTDTEQTNLRRSTEQTMFWLGNDSNPPTYPFLDYNLTWSGLEKIAFLGRATESISLSNALSSSMKEEKTSVDTSDVRVFRLQSRDYVRNWNPLLGIDITWKGGIGSSIKFDRQESFKDALATNQRTKTLKSGILVTVSYVMNTGFRLPLLWMSAIRLQNRTTFSMNFDYRKSLTAGTQTSVDTYVDREKTTSWSLQPRVDYSFSETVTGGAQVMMQQNKNEITHQTNRLFEFGIQVRIAIRG